jgi:SAM-dependent methyltransferase
MIEPLETTLRRLQTERERADRTYNEALTALDGALRPPPDLPATPAEYDEQQITPLNDAWNILPAPPAGTGFRGRLGGFVWRTLAPYLERQLAFNSRLVDHINRNAAVHSDRGRAATAALATLREHFAVQADIHSRLLALLQQITPYVDTKDREVAGRTLVLNASISALADSAARRGESAAARLERLERQIDVRASALERGQQDLQTATAVSHRAVTALSRELARTDRPSAGGPSDTAREVTARGEAFGSPLDAYKYVGFEDQFRGSEAEIRERLESYLPLFEGAADVLDVGCGRGEFIGLLRAHGITARGIDLNPEMVEVCRARGLDVTHADAVSHLAALDDDSLGGLFAAQVVEHLDPAYLLRFLELSFNKLRPGAPLVLETLNPACWVAFFESYIRDITHVRPLHPETLKYLVLASGFPAASLEYRSPVPERDRLQRAPETPAAAGLDQLVEAVNANVDKLNARLFTHLDYAIVASKPAAGPGGPPFP